MDREGPCRGYAAAYGAAGVGAHSGAAVAVAGDDVAAADGGAVGAGGADAVEAGGGGDDGDVVLAADRCCNETTCPSSEQHCSRAPMSLLTNTRDIRFQFRSKSTHEKRSWLVFSFTTFDDMILSA